MCTAGLGGRAILSKTLLILFLKVDSMNTYSRHNTRDIFENEPSLDLPITELRGEISKAMEIIVRLFERLEQASITTPKSPFEIASLFRESLPEDAQPIGTVLDQVERDIIGNSTLCLSPRFFGYINGSGNHAAILSEMLAAAVNQICAKWHFSPAASEVERQVVRWIADFVGYPKGSGGCLLSGGSAGNLIGLAVARKRKLGFQSGCRWYVWITSGDSLCFDRGARIH